MKHATDKELDEIDDLLVAVRSYGELKEKKRGIFYYFHEDAAGLFADLRVGDKFKRFGVNTPTERKKLQTILKTVLRETDLKRPRRSP